MSETIRKCKICKKPITIDGLCNDYFPTMTGKYIGYTHDDCYISFQTNEKKRGKKTIEECKQYISDQKNKKIFRDKNSKEKLYEFIFDMYDTSYFPNSFYIKMDSIFKGTYKNLNKPVSPDDLLDMWKQKKDYLNKVAEKNRKKDNEIKSISRVYYDLAILLSRYDAYLAWKEQQKISVTELENQKKIKTEKIEYAEIKRPKLKNKKKDNELDINSMLDEI